MTPLCKKRLKVWMAAPLCLFWFIWHERNRIAFDDEHFLVHRLKSSFLFTLGVMCNIIERHDSCWIFYLGFFCFGWAVDEGWWV